MQPTGNLQRALTPVVEKHLKIMPVVVLTGARQSGKTTLARDLVTEPRRFLTLDDTRVRSMSRTDPDSLLRGSVHSRPPVGFALPQERIDPNTPLSGPGPLTLDEIQREPNLLHAIKRLVDEERRTGQFLLTGSADLLLMKRISESLAGRASFLNLRPMTRRELGGAGRSGIWGELLRAPVRDWAAIAASQPSEPENWQNLVRRGGFPFPAAQIDSNEDRAVWFDGYVRTYLERDLHELSAVWSLPDFRRLMAAVSLNIGQTLNAAQLGRFLSMTSTMVSRHLKLLEASHLLVRVPAFTISRNQRLIKSAKLYWADPGLAMFLSQAPEPTNAHLENLILCDLLVFCDTEMSSTAVFHWRTSTGQEVNFVLEHERRLIPIDIKLTQNPHIAHGTRLSAFRRAYGDHSLPGLLIHCGNQVGWLASGILAVPWWKLI